MGRWLRHNALRGCSQATVTSYGWPLKRLLEWDAGHPAAPGTGIAGLLSSARIEAFLSDAADRGASANSRHALAATVRRFLRWLAGEGLLDDAPRKLPPVPTTSETHHSLTLGPGNSVLSMVQRAR